MQKEGKGCMDTKKQKTHWGKFKQELIDYKNNEDGGTRYMRTPSTFHSILP